MCGIFAIVDYRNSRPAHSWGQIVDKALDEMSHRGPDGSGMQILNIPNTPNLALGHVRLSIIDLARGAQPMPNEDGSVWISYNGETYNHVDLRRELERRGHLFRTRCDTEALVHGYEEWATDLPLHLRGMGAFVIWDDRKKRLFAARDRLGIKPIYYAWTGRTFVCASEIKAILATGLIAPELDREALREYLCIGYTASDRTLFRHIRKLLPGHRLVLADGRLRIDRYWTPRAGRAVSCQADEEELAAELCEKLAESVRLRLMADVPLGVFLSGGLDSSAIAALAARTVDRPLKTFSVGFDDPRYSELSYARTVAQFIDSEHHEVVVSREEFWSLLPKAIWHEDEPITFPSSIPLYVVARLAREHVKVVLTGEGSDELFGGYDKYWATLWNARYGRLWWQTVPRALQRTVRKVLEGALPTGIPLFRALAHTFLFYEPDFRSFALENFWRAIPAPTRRRLGQATNGRAFGPMEELWCRCDAGDLLQKLLLLDQQTYLVELLMKQDQMSMAASIESRVPFLDHELVEFANALPSELKVRGRSGKHILKRAVSRLLPAEILERRKMGFPTPIRTWFVKAGKRVGRELLRNELVQELFRPNVIDEIVEEHVSRRADHSITLWVLTNLALWHEIFFQNRAPAELSRGDLVRCLAATGS